MFKVFIEGLTGTSSEKDARANSLGTREHIYDITVLL